MLNKYLARIYVSCLRTQCNDAGEAGTSNFFFVTHYVQRTYQVSLNLI